MVEKEIEDIFSLLAYALVYQDWQDGEIPRFERRGYNVGALLVNPQDEPVAYDLNCINSTENATQHGEVRVITSYLEKNRTFDLAGYAMYTTLEPCIMCAGMMVMTSVDRIVYGQHDLDYSHALDRLAIDSRSIGGYPPYPRQVESRANGLSYCGELDQAYAAYLQAGNERILAKFLASETAEKIYNRVSQDFLNYEVRREENRSVYEGALAFLRRAAN